MNSGPDFDSAQDRNFDDLKGQFQQRIYQTSKGRIRLAVLNRDLQATIPALYQPPAPENPPWQVLDAGCGEAQFAGLHIPPQHHLTLCDHSEAMLQQAREHLNQTDRQGDTRFVNRTIQQLSAQPEIPPNSLDLILCHAVLEWVAEPEALLDALTRLLKPSGYLSLMFFNRHSTVFRCLIRGYLDKAKADNFSGSGEGLTPINPLLPEQVILTLKEMKYELLCHSGVRVFQDYMHNDVRSKRSEQDITELELRYSQQEPYRSLGRYIHLVLKHEA